MKFSLRLAIAAVTVSLGCAGVAQASSVIHYTFDPGSYYETSGSPNTAISGSFDYDSVTQTLSNVIYSGDGETFKYGSVRSNKELAFGYDFNYPDPLLAGDFQAIQFVSTLDNGGTVTIMSGTRPAIPIDAGGSISADVRSGGAVPEPASWALMLTGFAITGAALRKRSSLAWAAKTVNA